jgi:transposase
MGEIMPDVVMKSVQTQGVGFAPVLRHYFDRCRIQAIIDKNVPLDPRRKVLTHGEACIAMITGILFQVLQLYRICRFATDRTVLNVMMPHIAPREYFDDRLADSLDRIYDYGIGNLEMLITRQMINEFQIETDICHNDTTSASVYGECNNNRTPESIKITFGYSKKHRQDLKQLIWSLSVSSDCAFPLFQQAYSGNTADVDTYVEQWFNLVDLLERHDFLYVADSKLITKENMAHIHDNEGWFIAPAPMYESYKTVFHAALDQHDRELLIPYKNQVNRGFEVPVSVCHDHKEYAFRMIILYDKGLFARKSHTLHNRVENTRQAFGELTPKLNKYHLKTRESIEQASNSILRKYQTAEFFDYTISNTPLVTYKNKKQGRPARDQDQDKVEVVTDRFSLQLNFKDAAFEDALYRCGYYPLMTNKPEEDLTVGAAMMAHKSQYKPEHINRRAKSGYKLEPVYLHTPERIEAFLLLFKIALQLVVLIERTARNNIQARDKGLDNFMPNRMDVRNPRAEYMLKEFEYVVRGQMVLPDGRTCGFVSELTPLQKDILEIMEVPGDCFCYEYLFDTS